MTRDEAILHALLGGDRGTLELAAATGLTERVCRYGLRHLINADYVWSPERGRYRLTRRGRVIAGEISPAPEPANGSDAATAQDGTERPRRRLLGRAR